MGDNFTPELKNIRGLAFEQGAKRACEQVVNQTEMLNINDEFWALNPDKVKIKAEIIGPYTMVAVT